MANVLVERKSLEDIADAIRVKLNTQDLFKPEEFASKVMEIQECESAGTITYYTDIGHTVTVTGSITQATVANMGGAED